MQRVCVLFAQGFEEIEAITVVDVLRRADIRTTTVGCGQEIVEGSHGIRVVTEMSVEEAVTLPWDLVVLPGGMPGSAILRDDSLVQQLIRAQHARGARLAAICAAPIALASAGALDGRRATCFPGFEESLGSAALSKDSVVVDGTVTTSRGPACSLVFALELVAQLRGKERADALARSMLTISPPSRDQVASA